MLFGEYFLSELKSDIDEVLSEAVDADNERVFLLNNDLFDKLISFVRTGKNAEDNDAVQQYIIEHDYRIDFEDLLKNKDKWMMEQNYRDLLIQILHHKTILNRDKENFEELMIEMFRTSVSDIEKSQIANVTMNNISIKNKEFEKKFYRFYNNSDFSKEGSIQIKTNGFFSEDSSDVYYQQRVREKREILSYILEKISSLTLDSNTINEIKENFNEFNDEEDDFKKMQLRKIKIYLLFKTVGSEIYNKADNKKKSNLIKKVLNKEYDDFTTSIINTFCEKCDFGIISSFQDYGEDDDLLSTIDGSDIVKNISDDYGLIKKQKINDLFENINSFDNITFFEIKDRDCFGDDCVYSKNFVSYDGKNNLLLCFSSEKKKRILSAIYANKNCRKKIASKKYDIDCAADIYDFAKICEAMESDPMPIDNCEEVYDKYYLHEGYKGIGGLSEDRKFSIKKDSNENFIRNDLSCIISTNELFNLLKIQSKSARQLHELKVSISDIKNLPEMLKKYYDFIIYQRDVLNNKSLTPIDNLVIKNIDILSVGEIKQLVEGLENSPVCFKTLKIDDPNVFDYVVNSAVNVNGVKNNHVLYGKNDNFYHEINKERLKKQKDGDVFESEKTKVICTKYTKISKDAFENADLNGLLLKGGEEEEFKNLEKELQNRLEGSGGQNNDLERNTSVSTNLDKNIEFIMNMNKEPTSLNDLKENELISYNNVDEKAKLLLDPKNKRFSEKTKSFLAHVQKKVNGSFKELFDVITNRKNLSKFFKDIHFRDGSFYLTPEAFVSLIENFLYGGMTKFNGRIGDQRLSVFKICGDKKYVVGMTARNINYGYIHPIEEMFTFIPTTTVGLNEQQLKNKYANDIVNIISNTDKIEQKIDSFGSQYGYLKNVFLNNPKLSGLEYTKYISDNADEILSFLEYLGDKRDFIEICDSVCGNFCKQTQIGDINLLFSTINPVNFLRGMQKVFDLLEELKNKSFIDDEFIKGLPNILQKNKYAVQVVYELLLRRKVDVEKIVIANRNYNSNVVKESVDINDIKDVEKYFDQESKFIGNYGDDKCRFLEKNFSKHSFDGLLYYNDIISGGKRTFNYWNDVFCLDDCFESGGLLYKNIPNDVKIKLKIDQLKEKEFIDVEYETDEKKHEIYKDYLELCYFLNKRHNRLSDGTIDEPNLSKEEEFLINDKLAILATLNYLLQQNGEKSKKVFYVLVKLYNDILKRKNYELLPCLYSQITDDMDDDKLEELYNAVVRNKDCAFLEYILAFNDNNLSRSMLLAKNKLLEELAQIDNEKSIKIEEGDDGRQFNRRFAIKMFTLYRQINNPKLRFGFDDNEISNIIGEYTKQFGRSSIKCITDIFNLCTRNEENPRQEEDGNNLATENLKNYIALPDEMFRLCFAKEYIDKQENNENILDIFINYCCASDNNGKYSVLCDKRKKDPDGKEIEIFHEYLSKFYRGDILSVIEMVNQCTKKGLDLIDLINIVKSKKDIEQKNSFMYIYVLQKIYLNSVVQSKKFLLNDLSSIFDILTKVYFKDIEQDKDDISNTISYIEHEVDRDIEYIVHIFSCNVQSLNQNVRMLEENTKNKDCFSEFLKNFSSLISDCEEILEEKDEKQRIKFDESNIGSIIAKAYSKYEEILKGNTNTKTKRELENINKKLVRVNETINSFFQKINVMKICYSEAVEKNDKTKQAIMINLFNKILLLIRNRSIEDICMVFDIIGGVNLTTDSDILNKFSFIVEHIDEYKEYDDKNKKKIYENITELYNLSKGEKYLNTGLKHDELMKILDRIKKQNNQVVNVIDALKIVKNQIMDDFKKNISNNGGFLNNNLIDRVEKTLFNVVNGCADLIDKLYNKDDGRKTLEKINKIISGKDSPIETLFKDESIKLLGDCEMQKLMALISDVFSQLINDQKSVDMALTSYENKMKNGQSIFNYERLVFIAAFLVAHTRDQNKTLRCHQLAATMLENFKALNNEIVLTNTSSRNINLIQTGGGKTLTMLFGLFKSTLEGLSSFAVTTNKLLVNEMMNDAEKNSLFKNHIFYLDDNQNLIEKSTNRKIPINEVLEILKDKRNKFFVTYKDLSFWIQKLLRERYGIKIIKYLKDYGALFLDEVDSVIDAKTSNKISMSYDVDAKKYNLVSAMQELYNSIIDKEKSNKNFLKIIKNDNSRGREYEMILRKIINNAISDNIESTKTFEELDYETKSYIMKVAIACLDANKMKDGVEYTINTNSETGVSTIVPIVGGEPDTSGSKFDQFTNRALKIKLKYEGHYFDDILSDTMIISEGNNASVMNYFKRIDGFSGTLYGAREIWGKKGFKVHNIETMSVPNIKRVKLFPTFTDNEGENVFLDFIFLCSAISNRNDLGLYTDFLKDTFGEKVQQVFNACNVNYEESEINGIFDRVINQISNLEQDNYFLTFMRNSNELEAFRKRLENNLDSVVEYANETGLDFKRPEIVALDKKQYLIDDQVVRSKLENKDNDNLFVFALIDTGRGYDYPRSPKLIESSVFSHEIISQIRGRTGRNEKPGTIIEACSITDDDMNLIRDSIEDNKSRLEKFLNVVRDIDNDTNDNDIVERIKDEYSKKSVTDYVHKDVYYKMIEYVSASMSIFLNLATENLDNENRDKVFNDSNQICSKFIELIGKGFKTLEQDDIYARENFENNIYEDLDKILKSLYDKCCLFPENNTPPLGKLLRETFKTLNSIRNDKVNEYDDNLEDKKYRARDEKQVYNERNRKIKQANNNNDEIYIKVYGKNYTKSEILRSDNYNKFLFTILGCADACGYNFNHYKLNGGGSIYVLKKKIFDGDSTPFSYKERCIALISSKSGDHEEMEEIIRTLPEDCLMLFNQIEPDKNFYVQQGLDSEKNPIPIDDRDGLVYIVFIELIKQFTQNGIFDQSKVFDACNKYQEGFKNKVFNFRGNYQTLLCNDIENKILGYAKKGLAHSADKGVKFSNETGQKYIEFQEKIREFAKFSLEPSEEDLSQINGQERSLLYFLNKKIISFVEDIRNLKDEIENCDNIEYSKKEYLMREINKLDSKDNLIELLKRAMKNIAFSSQIQETISDFKILKNKINADNIDASELELQKLIDSMRNSEDFVDNVKKSNSDEDVNLKKTLYSGYNDIVSNINYAQNKLDKIKTYKQELELIERNKLFFNGFESSESVIIATEEINNYIDKYQKFIDNIEKEKQDFFPERQKEQLKDDAIDKHINNAIDIVFNELDKVLNEFTLTYGTENNADFSDIGIGEFDIKLIDNIKKLYTNRFKKISKNNGINWPEIIKEVYDKKDEIDYDDNEDVEKNIKNKYDEDLVAFKGEIKSLLVGYQNDIIKNSEEKVDDAKKKQQLPVTTYTFFKKMLKFFQRNYKRNFEKHSEVKKNIIGTIVSVFNVIKANIYNCHDQFKDELSTLIQKNIPGFTIDNFDITEETINELNECFDKLDITDLKDIQKQLSVIVSGDMERTEEVIKKMKANVNEPNIVFKIIFIICTLGSILLTKNGRNMFKNKKIIKEHIKLEEKIKPKPYFIKGSKKEKNIDERLSSLNVSIDNVDVVDITQYDKQIINNVQNNLNTNYNGVNLT